MMENKKMICLAADRSIDGDKNDWNMNINSFDWCPGVGLFGIYKAYEKTENRRYFDFLVKWSDEYLMLAYDKKTVNSTAPLLTVISLYGETKNKKYLEVCKDIAEYIITKAPLTREGGLEHTVMEASADFKEQIWADTLFMTCLFLVKMGIIVDKKYAEFAVNQLKIHLKFLFNEKTGLYYHGWNCSTKSFMSAIHWGRANAWIIYSATEIINLIGAFEGIDEVEIYIRLHAEALRKYQRENGGFGTIIDDETSYDETSAVSGIAAGIKNAINLGIVTEDYNEMYQKSIEYIKRMIDNNGIVMSVSTGTPIMSDSEAYKSIRHEKPTLYGQTLAILALCMDNDIN